MQFSSKFIENMDEWTMYELDKSYFYGLAKIVGVWILIVFLFLLSPSITIKAFAKSFVQVLLIGSIYLILKWLRTSKK
jgi:hypothetical protein